MPSDCDRSCKDFDGIFDPPGIRTEHDELAGDITGVTDLDRLPDDILTFLVVLAPYVELLGGDYMDDSSIGFDGRHADLGGATRIRPAGTNTLRVRSGQIWLRQSAVCEESRASHWSPYSLSNDFRRPVHRSMSRICRSRSFLPRIIAIVAHVETFPAETAEHPAILLFGGLPLQDDQRPPPSMVPAS